MAPNDYDDDDDEVDDEEEEEEDEEEEDEEEPVAKKRGKKAWKVRYSRGTIYGATTESLLVRSLISSFIDHTGSQQAKKSNECIFLVFSGCSCQYERTEPRCYFWRDRKLLCCLFRFMLYFVLWWSISFDIVICFDCVDVIALYGIASCEIKNVSV